MLSVITILAIIHCATSCCVTCVNRTCLPDTMYFRDSICLNEQVGLADANTVYGEGLNGQTNTMYFYLDIMMNQGYKVTSSYIWVGWNKSDIPTDGRNLDHTQYEYRCEYKERGVCNVMVPISNNCSNPDCKCGENVYYSVFVEFSTSKGCYNYGSSWLGGSSYRGGSYDKSSILCGKRCVCKAPTPTRRPTRSPTRITLPPTALSPCNSQRPDIGVLAPFAIANSNGSVLIGVPCNRTQSSVYGDISLRTNRTITIGCVLTLNSTVYANDEIVYLAIDKTDVAITNFACDTTFSAFPQQPLVPGVYCLTGSSVYNICNRTILLDSTNCTNASFVFKQKAGDDEDIFRLCNTTVSYVNNLAPTGGVWWQFDAIEVINSSVYGSLLSFSRLSVSNSTVVGRLLTVYGNITVVNSTVSIF